VPPVFYLILLYSVLSPLVLLPGRISAVTVYARREKVSAGADGEGKKPGAVDTRCILGLKWILLYYKLWDRMYGYCNKAR
jgi:hypothetical protein